MGERAKAVVIHGLRDLLGTSLVTALGARGFDVTAAEQTSGPAIALVDLDVPGSAHAVGRAARRGWTVIGLASDDVAVAAAVAAGATGCFPKSAPLPKLTDLMHAAAEGREVMDPAERERLRTLHTAREERRQSWAERLKQLSPREREVLKLLDEGLTGGRHRRAAVPLRRHRPHAHPERPQQARGRIPGTRGRDLPGDGRPRSLNWVRAQPSATMGVWPDTALQPPSGCSTCARGTSAVRRSPRSSPGTC